MPRQHLSVTLVLALLLATGCGPGLGPTLSTPGPESSAAPADRLLPLDAEAHQWVDSVLASLNTRGRVAQLVFPWMWGRYVPSDSDEGRQLRSWVADAGVGGIITSIGPPVTLADKLNRLQRQAAVPLLVAADLESGPGMRLRGGTLLPYGVDMGSGTVFPPAMALGATGDPSLAYEMGRISAAEARAVGIHLVFAPVVDVNNNPANPIINTRSYGGDPSAVAEFAVAQITGLQDHGVLATAKHFPGHGDAEADTHLTPFILRIDAARADSVELVPYRAAIQASVAGVMTAHIAFPELAGDSTTPATLSPRMLDSLLVRELGFDGLVVTDALNMGAIVERFGADDAAVRALEAGADILLQPVDPAVMIDAVTAAVESGRIPAMRLERSVRKVLEAKARVGLHRTRTVDAAGVADVVGSDAHRAWGDRAAERAVTLLRDWDDRVSLVPLRERDVLLVTYSDAIDPFAGRELARALGEELPSVRRTALGPEAPHPAVLDSLVAEADSADLVIVAVDARVRAGEGAGALDSLTAAAIGRIALARPTILVSLGNPYLLDAVPNVGTYVLGWSGADVSQRAVARALLGRAAVAGRTPIAIPPGHDRGEGLVREPVGPGRLARVTPGTALDAPAEAVEDAMGPGRPAAAGSRTEVGRLRAAALDSVVGVLEDAVEAGLTPGAVVVVGTSRGGAWTRAVGRTDWAEGAPPVDDSTLYDMASLTKVVATTSAVMRLVESGRVALDEPLSTYLPQWGFGGWRDSVTVRRLLTHTTGLPPFVEFWRESEGGLRGDSAYVAAISRLVLGRRPGTRYEYSDLGFILLGAMVAAVADTSLDGFVEAEFWEPLGMRSTGFNPSGPLGRIAPTEVDRVLRRTHVHGVVHDENAWAMGGVAGHAGLFSTATDLARFAHMLLRAGRLGESRVLGPGVVAMFTERQPDMDRALGWDAAQGTGIAESFSDAAFGHTGFTGTSLWIDPERDLYVILLTNRVNPTRERTGIGVLRRAVHRWAVEAVR
jgi:beta-N-acetylhexosaminidase